MQKTQDIDFKPSPKQWRAFELLEDDETTELLFGGSIGSGKSYLACVWVILRCLKYPNTRYLIGRSRLQNLKRTTIKTFMDVIEEWHLKDYMNFNRVDNVITFNNGSEVILMDLFQYPSDPEFVKLGSLELTGAVIDEGGEISAKVYNILKTRLRYKLDEYGLSPKLLIVSNPTKNWLYTQFYKPAMLDELPRHRKFIQALPHDNPYLSKSYLDSLTPENLGMGDYKRLVKGNWEVDEDDYALFLLEDILNATYKNVDKEILNNKRYITCDPASSGKDKTVILVWFDTQIVKKITLDNNDTQSIVKKIKELMQTYNIKINKVIIDSIGIGRGVFDLLKGSIGFVANARPFNSEPYKSLKDQCYFKLSEMFKNGSIVISDMDDDIETLEQELSAHKKYKVDEDGKNQVTPKKIVKQQIGRSPDIADAVMMRAYFEYKSNQRTVFM